MRTISVFKKTYFVALYCSLVIFLSGCQNINVPEMPSMPNFSSWFGQKERAETHPPTPEPIIHTTDQIQNNIDLTTPPLYCDINEGTINFAGQWYTYTPVRFTLRKGEYKEIGFRRSNGAEIARIGGRFEPNGQKIVFCPLDALRNQKEVICASLYALEDDLYTGIRRTLDVQNALRGGQIECKMSRR